MIGKGSAMTGVRRIRTVSGFTLIELLIVIAIIAILALIAVPNFLEAQMRAKVTRIQNDLRVIATGMESYFSDWGDYPERTDEGALSGYASANMRGLLRLSTPLAYLNSVPFDPFGSEVDGDSSRAKHRQLTYEVASTGCSQYTEKGWAAYSCGPDRRDDTDGVPFYPGEVLRTTVYDVTNGTVSKGDVLRFGPRPFKEKIRYNG